MRAYDTGRELDKRVEDVVYRPIRIGVKIRGQGIVPVVFVGEHALGGLIELLPEAVGRVLHLHVAAGTLLVAALLHLLPGIHAVQLVGQVF